jgi:hypothetical protein
MSVALTEDAMKLRRQLVALTGKYPGGYVPDRILLETVDIDPKAYDDAAQELIANQLAETQVQISDPSSLKPTPKGMRLARGV